MREHRARRRLLVILLHLGVLLLELLEVLLTLRNLLLHLAEFLLLSEGERGYSSRRQVN